MDNIKKYNYIIVGYLLTVFILFSSNLIFKFESMWGLNQLLFIEKPTVYIFSIPFIFIFLGSIFMKDSFGEDILENHIYNWIFVNRITFSLFSITLLLFLYFFRIKTFFLGDGYSWIASFSYPDYFLVKPTEFLSSYILRGIQFMLGGYSKETSLLAFQIVSFVSGVIFFFNLKNILDLLIVDKRLKVFTFLSFLFSGLTLLFMGYVEFYPILWMSASFYLYFSLKSFKSKKYLLWSVLLFVIMILIHAQAVYLGFGFIYILVWRNYKLDKIKRQLKRHLPLILFVSTTLSVGILFIMYNNFKIAQILLPLFSSNPENPGYFVFSISHIFDIINLIFLLFPIFIIFTILIVMSYKKIKIDNIGFYFILSSLGSLFFLLLVNPYIGFARDWDLMSMTLLLPVLLTFYLFDTIKIKLHGKTIIIALALLASLSTSFLYVNISKEKSLKRFETILRIKQGLQFRPGWTILNNYYLANNEPDKSVKLQNEMKQKFAEYFMVADAYKKLEQRKLQQAYNISTQLINKYPQNIDFIQLRGSVFIYLNNYDSAQFYLDKALNIQNTYPAVLKCYGDLLVRKGDFNNAIIMLEKANLFSHGRTDIIEPLCSCYIRSGKIEKAVKFAHELYLKDKHSPSYHIISMFINLQMKNKEKTIYHYQQFLKYGKKRSDYEQIKKKFSYLTNGYKQQKR